jgi:nucleotide sugar dehydrogenase
MYFNKIGIVGLGFVGSAVAASIDHGGIGVVTVDTDPNRANGTYKDLMDCEGIFVCVPSPSNADGSCDTSILENVLENLKDYDGVIISKCTVPPSKYAELNNQYKNLVYSPEFLTAANAKFDYMDARFLIIGGRVKAYIHEAERLIRLGQTNLEIVEHCTIEEAALLKYTINSFLATKVIFMNEIQQVASAANINYDKIARMLKFDERIGKSHLQVPGPDETFGFGGACFPKDTQALMKYAESLNIPMNVLEAAVKKNTFLRLTEPK